MCMLYVADYVCAAAAGLTLFTGVPCVCVCCSCWSQAVHWGTMCVCAAAAGLMLLTGVPCVCVCCSCWSHAVIWGTMCVLGCPLQLGIALREDNVQLDDTVSVYETENGEYRATFLIEFLDPNTDVVAVEARLNIGSQQSQQQPTQRRKRQDIQPVLLNPDVSQSQGFIVSSKQCMTQSIIMVNICICVCSTCTHMYNSEYTLCTKGPISG